MSLPCSVPVWDCFSKHNLCPLIGHWVSRTSENLLGLCCQAEWLWWQWPQTRDQRLYTFLASDWSESLNTVFWLADFTQLRTRGGGRVITLRGRCHSNQLFQLFVLSIKTLCPRHSLLYNHAQICRSQRLALNQLKMSVYLDSEKLCKKYRSLF